jgi:hypothetical protein
MIWMLIAAGGVRSRRAPGGPSGLRGIPWHLAFRHAPADRTASETIKAAARGGAWSGEDDLDG